MRSYQLEGVEWIKVRKMTKWGVVLPIRLRGFHFILLAPSFRFIPLIHIHGHKLHSLMWIGLDLVFALNANSMLDSDQNSSVTRAIV